MVCDGTVVDDSEVIYWRDPPASAPPSLAPVREDKYLTFEYDSGGWNNIRMGIECVLVLGHYLRRTVVLPPAQSLYLIAKQSNGRRDFGLADFLNTTLLASHPGWRTLTMPDFLKKHVAGAPATDAGHGRQMWKFVERASDATLPPLSGRYLAFGDEGYRPPLAPSAQQAHALKDDLHAARHVHSPGSGNHRILRNFYSFLFFQDRAVNRFYKRFVRDYTRYQDPIQCAAARVVAALRGRAAATGVDDFYALHVRRNDFQFREAKIGAADIVANLAPIAIPRGALVFLATDDPGGTCKGCLWERKPCDSYPIPRPKKYGCPDDPSWAAFEEAGWNVVMLGDFIPTLLKDVNPNYYGMVDQVVCSRAKVWAGTYWSTFSAYIHRMRGYHGLGEASYYHTPNKLRELQVEKRSGPGWMREWRAGWTDDDAGALVDR